MTTSKVDDYFSLGSWSHLQCPELIVKEAFQAAPGRVVAQIAAALETSKPELERLLTELGISSVTTPRDVLHLAEHLGISVYFYQGRRLIHIDVRDNKDAKALVFAAWDGLLYFYAGAGARARDDAQAHLHGINLQAPSARLAKSARHVHNAITEEDRDSPTPSFPFHLDLAQVPAGIYTAPGHVMRGEEDSDWHMQALLERFLHSRRYPMITMTSGKRAYEAVPRELLYHKNPHFQDEGTGAIRVRLEACDSDLIRQWAQKLDMPYAGQTLQSFTQLAVDVVLRRKQRRFLTDAEKSQLRAAQGNQCASCGDVLDASTAYDHMIPLHQMLRSQDLDAFQAICGQCHADKTKTEPRALVGILRSHFNRPLFASYIGNATSKPSCMVFKPEDIEDMPCTSAKVASSQAVDIVRSRFNALYEIAEPGLPIFTALDSSEAVSPSEPLPDLVYVDTEADHPADLASLMASLPYNGPGWYMRPAVEFLLHTCKVTWADLKRGVRATAHVPGDAMRDAFDVLDRAWDDVYADSLAEALCDHEKPANFKGWLDLLESTTGQRLDDDATWDDMLAAARAAGIEPRLGRNNPRKDSINSWVGLCGQDAAFDVKTRYTFEPDIAVASSADVSVWRERSTHNIPGLYRISTERRILDSGTYRPLYDYCLSVEHTRLAQAYQACAAVFKIVRQPVSIKQLTVDGFIWDKPRKNVTAEKLRETLEALTFGDLHRLEDALRERLAQPEPKQKRLKTTDLYPIAPRESAKQVFRVLAPAARQHLRGMYSMGNITRTRCEDYDDEDDDDRAFEHLAGQEEALSIARDGGSLLILGLAGVGKSHFIRQVIIPELEAQGKRITILAKTHNAAMVAGGDTADHFAYKHIREGGASTDVVWVDEISMLDLALLQDLNHLSFRKPRVQFILSGDFNQYEPFFNSFLGEPVRIPLRDSQLLYDLSEGHLLIMTECRRSDAQLFDFYSSLVEEPMGALHGDLKASLDVARRTFTEERATGFIPVTKLAPTNLVLSHKRRMVINQLCNEAEAKAREDAVWFSAAEFGSDAESLTNKPQDAYFWPGMIVVACSSGRKVRNGNQHKITSICEKSVTVCRMDGQQNIGENADDNEIELVLTRSQFFCLMRLAYAVTYASAQGLTIEGLLALHDTGHHHFDQKKLYVGASRARACELLVVY